MPDTKLTRVSLPPVQLSLFPASDTVGEALAELDSRLPITTHNELVSALGLYHNTVLYGYSHPEHFKTWNHENSTDEPQPE